MIRQERDEPLTTGMLVIVLIGAAFGGWAALALMGGERSRRLNQIESQRPPVAVATIAPPPVAAARSSPSRRPGAPKSSKAAASKKSR